MGWLTGYSARREIAVPTFPNTQTGIVFKVNVTYTSSMASDFRDIQFTDEDGTTLLGQWMETYTASISSVWWFSVDVNTIKDMVYMYYGNPSAVLNSSTSIFAFYDDFSGDLSGWNTIGDVSIEGGVLHLDMNTGGTCRAVSTTAVDLTLGYRVHAVVKLANGNANAPIRNIGFGTVASQSAIMGHKKGFGTNKWFVDATDTAATEIDDGSYHTIDCVTMSSSTAKFYLDSVYETTLTDSFSVSTLGAYFGLWTTFYPNADMYVNSVLIAKSGTADWEFLEPAETEETQEETQKTGKVDIRLRLDAKELLTDIYGGTRYIVSSEVREPLSGLVKITGVYYEVTGSMNGYDDQAPYYKEASGGTLTPSLGGTSVLYIKNTGCQYVSPTELGDENDRLVKVSVAGTMVSALPANGPYIAYDPNGMIASSGIVVTTTESDGSAVVGTGNAVEFLALAPL